jgi:hypothetical protein
MRVASCGSARPSFSRPNQSGCWCCARASTASRVTPVRRWYVRVNANNVDLNRNCQVAGESLFATDSVAYEKLSDVLAPRRQARVGAARSVHFYGRLLSALALHGERTLRQASIGGQYSDPQGVFFGGDRVEPEIAFFQRLYERLAATHREVLLADLHTGYGVRGEAYALFGRADSPAIRACSEQGVSDASGHDRAYTVHGDLITYCYQTAKRVMPDGLFDGVALEIGTHGLSVANQLADLHTVVLENQLRQHAGGHTGVEPAIREAFRELFYPRAPEWRARAVQVGSRGVEALLRARGYVAGA